MATKRINFDFFTVNNIIEQNKDLLDLVLQSEFNNVKRNIYNNVNLFGYLARVREIYKNPVNPALTISQGGDYYWIVTVERVNTDEEAYVADELGNRQTYGNGPNEGPVIDTVFLYNPNNNIFVVNRSRGGLGFNHLTTYLSNLTGSEDLILEIIIDPDVLDKLNKIPLIKYVEYSISSPTTFKAVSNKSRTLDGDFELARKLLAGRMKIIIGSEKGGKLSLENVKAKVKTILSLGESEIKGLVVKGERGGSEETLDLIKQRVIFTKVVNVPKGKKVNYIMIMDYAEEAYKDKSKLLNTLYINKK